MAGSRAFASLSATLLARKGGARPAMRPALAPAEAPALDQVANDPLDDCGWNDLGSDVPPPAAVVALEHAAAEPLLARKPVSAEVVQLVRDVAATKPASLATALSRPVVKRTRTAAFTLRLDPDRHFRLRLACALKGRSAQALVTAALDRFLAAIPEIEPLADQVDQQRIA